MPIDHTNPFAAHLQGERAMREQPMDTLKASSFICPNCEAHRLRAYEETRKNGTTGVFIGCSAPGDCGGPNQTGTCDTEAEAVKHLLAAGLKPTVEPIESGEWGACPKCGVEHPDGEGKTVSTHFVPYLDDFGGSGYREFLCTGCGTLLREDIG